MRRITRGVLTSAISVILVTWVAPALLQSDLADAESWSNKCSRLPKGPEALKACRKAAAENPRDASVQNNLGAELAHAGRNKEAIDAYRKAIQFKPDHASAHFGVGYVLKKLGRYKEAIAAYRKAIKIKPDYVDAYNNMGDSLDELGRYKEAIAAFREAIKIKPGFVYAHYAHNNIGVSLNNLVPRSRVLLDTRLIHDSWRKGCRDERTKARGGFGGGRP